MTSDRQLKQLAVSPEGELEALLDSLSNAQFRVSGDVLCNQVLPTLTSDEAWRLIIRLTRYNRRAFLGTILKALSRPGSSHLFSDDGLLRLWAADMTDTDRHKTLLALLPTATTPQDVSMMLEVFGRQGQPLGRGHDIDYLLEAGTSAAYFVLLGYMRTLEYNKPMLTTICRRAMQRGDSLSFNAASLFKVFFDLSDVHGTFSLRIEPYELGRLEHDYQLFLTRLGNI